jgi:hypothetical protein
MSWVTGAYGGADGVCARAEPANIADAARIEISLFIFFFLSGVISAEKLRDVLIRGPNSTTPTVCTCFSLNDTFSAILPQGAGPFMARQHDADPRSTKMLFCCNALGDIN